ncbi:MAG: hypothetical protein GY696_36995 [Gammaproteobacteria bacterium]|nr:hypothetical protein [Gammaproteobacteria bacterium]
MSKWMIVITKPMPGALHLPSLCPSLQTMDRDKWHQIHHFKSPVEGPSEDSLDGSYQIPTVLNKSSPDG